MAGEELCLARVLSRSGVDQGINGKLALVLLLRGKHALNYECFSNNSLVILSGGSFGMEV
jgi:hypothetical protein